MISFLLVSLPVFGMVGLGWAAVTLRITPIALPDALGAFSFRFALPALVVRLIASERLDSAFSPLFFAGYLTSGSLMFLLMFAVSRRLLRQTPQAASAGATTATVSNLGFLGPPLVLAFFGPRGAGPLAMAIVAEVMILMSVGAAIMAGARTRRRGCRPAYRSKHGLQSGGCRDRRRRPDRRYTGIVLACASDNLSFTSRRGGGADGTVCRGGLTSRANGSTIRRGSRLPA